MVDFTIFHDELAKIRERIVGTIQKINTKTAGEPFYGRVILTDGQCLAGLISDLEVNKYKISFRLTEKTLNEKRQPVSKVLEKKIDFDRLRSIDAFKTELGKPISIE